jgi:hypothetical protein
MDDPQDSGRDNLASEKKRARPSLQIKPEGSRIAPDSAFYTRLLPAVLLIMAVVTLTLIIIATGILLGVIPYR